MRSGNSLFSPALFRQAIRRGIPFWCVYLVAWFFTSVLPIIAMQDTDSMISLIPSLGIYGGLFIEGIGCLFAAGLAFSPFFRFRSAEHITQLPVRRESIFFSLLAGGFVPMAAINVVIFLLVLLFSGLPVSSLHWLAGTLLELVIFYGLAVFSCCITGHLVAMPIFYGVLNALPLVMEVLMMLLVPHLCYGITSEWTPVTRYITPVYAIAENVRIRAISSELVYLPPTLQVTGYTVLLLFAAISLIWIGFAFVLFLTRRTETCGDVVPHRVLLPFLQVLAASVCCLGLGTIGFIIVSEIADSSTGSDLRSVFLLTFFLIVAFALGWFFSEFLLKKDRHVFTGKNWAICGIASVVLILLTVGLYLDPIGITAWVPDVSDVDTVYISTGANSGTFGIDGLAEVLEGTGLEEGIDSEQNIADVVALHREIVENRNSLRRPYGGWYGYVNFTYTLKNGAEVYRQYFLYESGAELSDRADEISLRKEALLSESVPSTPVTEDSEIYFNCYWYEDGAVFDISGEEAYSLWKEGLIPDIVAYYTEALENRSEDEYGIAAFGYSGETCIGELSVSIDSKDNRWYPITADMENTFSWLIRHGYLNREQLEKYFDYVDAEPYVF